MQGPGNWNNQSLHRSYSTGKKKNSVPPSVHTAQTNNSSKRKAGYASEVFRMFVVGAIGDKILNVVRSVGFLHTGITFLKVFLRS